MAESLTVQEAAQYFPRMKRITNKGHEEFEGPCPICKTGDNRFSIFPNDAGIAVWWCRAGQHPKLHPQYYFVDYLLDMLGIRRLEDGAQFSRAVLLRPTIDPPKFDELITQPVQLTLDDAIRFNKNSSPSTKYFGQYGINQHSIDRFKLGYAVKPPHCSLPAGFSIPNISHGPNGSLTLRSMQIRRDEDACLREALRNSATWMEDKRYELLEKWVAEVHEGRRSDDYIRNPTDDELFNYLGWPKYSSIKGSHNGIWGDDLISFPDGSRPGPRLPYIFLVEDAKSAIVLRQDGWPAVAYRRRNDWNAYLHVVFGRVGVVYAIYDNDGGIGLGYAQQFEECIARGGTTAVQKFTTPAGIKQISDLTRQDGFDAMRSWIDSKVRGLPPILDSYNE